MTEISFSFRATKILETRGFSRFLLISISKDIKASLVQFMIFAVFSTKSAKVSSGGLSMSSATKMSSYLSSGSSSAINSKIVGWKASSLFLFLGFLMGGGSNDSGAESSGSLSGEDGRVVVGESLIFLFENSIAFFDILSIVDSR